MTDAPERIKTRHYANGIINARADDWFFSSGNAIFEGEYIRADIAEAERKAADELANAVAYLETADAFGGTEVCILDALNALKAYRRAKAIRGEKRHD
jgi:hypothetical protein